MSCYALETFKEEVVLMRSRNKDTLYLNFSFEVGIWSYLLLEIRF